MVHYGRGSTSQRLPDGPWELIAVNRRSVVRRAFGARRERAAHAAFLLNLGLRSGAKRVWAATPRATAGVAGRGQSPGD